MSGFTVALVILLLILAGLTTYALIKRQETLQGMSIVHSEMESLEAKHREETESARKKMANQEVRHQEDKETARKKVANQEARHQEDMDAARHRVEEQETRHRSELMAVHKSIAKLERYRQIPDALEKAQRLKSQAEATMDEARKQAESAINEARNKAEEIMSAAVRQGEEIRQRAEREAETTRVNAEERRRTLDKEIADLLAAARAEVKAKRSKADETLNNATVYAAEIVKRAEEKAVTIGGKPYEAMKRAEFYERTATAMRNAVDGYGDRYVKPTETILDELAKEYGFHKAGERLGLARDRIRIMEKNHTAATCDYVEANRRQLAINFVLDAFNGKVDSILTRLRLTNLGTLEQEIRDARASVNFNGSAFRDARVTEEFLEARLDELKWARAVQELKQKERDEQRVIKEKIREEERAQREFQRSIRQAQRDEELLKKAMDKLRQEYDLTNTEERAKYEGKLLELNAKLKEAEERNQRAISMAQQTRCGHVYVISNIGSFGEDVIKIGLTRRLEPTDRVRELGDASVPFAFDVHTLIYSDDAPALETALHKRFLQLQVNKVNRRKEFFRVKLSDIRNVLTEMKLDAKWTLTADATEYRETLAIERRIQEDPEFRKHWTERQMEFTPADAIDDEELTEDLVVESAVDEV